MAVMPKEFQNCSTDMDGLLLSMSEVLLKMLRSQFEQLVQLLYQLDIDELKARKAFASANDVLIAEALAYLILERCLQKLETRAKYAQMQY